MSPGLRMIRDTIYALKQEYGVKIALVNAADTLNLTTGKRTSVFVTQIVPKAILLPANMNTILSRIFNFNKMGLIDLEDRAILLDKRDIQAPFVITVNTLIGYSGDGKTWVDLTGVTWNNIGSYNTANNKDIRKVDIKKVEDSICAIALTVRGISALGVS